MKKLTWLFTAIVIMGLLLVPATYLLSAHRAQQPITFKKDVLFNFDFLSRWVSRGLYPLGISLDPDNVVIGKEDWLFLGDAHAQVRTITRRGRTAADIETSRQIDDATREWEHWLKAQGVELFKIMVAPNKDTIYPEYLPRWAQPPEHTSKATFFSVVDDSRYIDLAIPLRSAKAKARESLHYKTDTHWTPLGAGIAFQYFAQVTNTSFDKIAWLPDDKYDLAYTAERPAGDLASFLRLENDLKDKEVTIQAYSLPATIVQYDFNTGKVVYQGPNVPLITPFTPQHIINANALNTAKVLWLRDSFGTLMSPLMMLTFTETLQLYHAKALESPTVLMNLVEKFKPDYVFITVVERDSRHRLFTALPSRVSLLADADALFVPHSDLDLVNTHHFDKSQGTTPYQVSGEDPFWVFSSNFRLADFTQPYLKITLSCNDQSAVIPGKIYWREEGMPHYSEEKSFQENFRQGTNLLHLNGQFGLVRNKAIIGIRLDPEAKGNCRQFVLGKVIVGDVL